ncbi:MAG: SDR family oxidoreductase [Pirellulaceae bacterium]|nr:SDR family oxidoreductase [Pirellulaceae bacterium]
MLENTSVVVTGGASGIGLGVARAFALAGAKVAIGGRRSEVVESAVASIQAPGRIFGHVLDVADRKQVTSFFQWSEQTIGETQILVQAAGINIPNRKIDSIAPEDWDRVLATNATGAFNCMIAVLPKMRAKRSGLIINISSVAGKRAIALGGVAYCASKFAMTAMGTCVANEVAEDGVRITNVYPGEVNTPILDQRPTPVSAEHKQRILQPEDVASMIVAVAMLPANAHVPEIVIKPVTQVYF